MTVKEEAFPGKLRREKRVMRGGERGRGGGVIRMKPLATHKVSLSIMRSRFNNGGTGHCNGIRILLIDGGKLFKRSRHVFKVSKDPELTNL